MVGNEVREGGFQVGLLSDMRPVRFPNGQVGAQLTLQLSKKNGDVPVDSRASIKPLSLLGLKYVDITKGQSRKLVADGGVLPISRTTGRCRSMTSSTRSTPRRGWRSSRIWPATGCAGRARVGAERHACTACRRCWQHLQPVAHYLSQPSTGLVRFFNGLNEFMGAVAPVAQSTCMLFRDMATTFKAIASDPNALEQTIAQVAVDQRRVDRLVAGPAAVPVRPDRRSGGS